MDFKTFFINMIMMSFFVSVTCITAAMLLLGLVFQPEVRIGYEVFLSPLLFGAISSIPLLVKYSKAELTIRQTIVRNTIHFILLELSVMSVLYFGGILTTIEMAVSLGVSILLIDITVNLVLWVNDKRTAKQFNEALKKWQSNVED
jgi:hypothetical protein